MPLFLHSFYHFISQNKIHICASSNIVNHQFFSYIYIYIWLFSIFFSIFILSCVLFCIFHIHCSLKFKEIFWADAVATCFCLSSRPECICVPLALLKCSQSVEDSCRSCDLFEDYIRLNIDNLSFHSISLAVYANKSA